MKKRILAAVMTGMMAMTALTACSGKTQEEVTLLLAAAASMKLVYDEQLIPMFEKAHPGVKIEGTYDSSGKLQTQIEEGLEADIFSSAANKQMESLAEQGLVEKTSVVNLLENKLVLIVPEGKDGAVTGFDDLLSAQTIAVGDPESVPAGQYAKEALESMGIWADVEAKSTKGTNVTEILNWVAEKSADAGLVYATDAASESRVIVIEEVPEGMLKSPVIYPIGMVAQSAHPKEANAFLEFLQSEEALRVFESYGFARVQ